MKEILESAITNNIIAALSLIVSIIGLIITGRTMKSAKKIQEEMEKMKVNALDKSRFMIYKPKAINQITKKITAVRNAQKLSKSVCREISSLIIEIEGFESIIKEADYNLLNNLHQKIKCLGFKQSSYDDADLQDCIEILIKIKNILEKGDYAI